MFSKDDFNSDNAQRISVIIMTEMKLPPLTSFKVLTPSQKTKFNRLMNKYIQSKQQDDKWFETLMNDFNCIVNEDILNEDFDPSKLYVPICNTEPQLLL